MNYLPQSHFEELVHFFPCSGFEGHHGTQLVYLASYFRGAEIRVIVEPNGPAAHVFRQLYIGDAVADNIGVGNIVLFVVEIVQYHADARFAGMRIISGKGPVDEHGAEVNAFSLERFHNEVVQGQEGFFRERRSAQTVLVADHHQFIIQLPRYPTHIFKHMRVKGKLVKRIYLVGGRRFVNERAVPVYEQYPFHLGRSFFTSSAVTASALFPKLFLI